MINKPAGMIVHPGAGAETGTLVAALLDRFGATGLSTVGGPLRPGIVHRLDKGTSGALLIARNDFAHKKLVEDFRDRHTSKRTMWPCCTVELRATPGAWSSLFPATCNGARG